MAIGVVGKKIGMTRVFTADHKAVPVTVVEVEPNRICQIKTKENEGYSAIQVTTGSKKTSRMSKSAIGHLAKAKVDAGRGFWEFRLDEADHTTSYADQKEINVEIFKEGQMVDVTGTTLGKGFAGVVKRHGFTMGDASHGNSLSHRTPGSVGQNQSPGRVYKGKRMAGHLGHVRQTIQNLEVVKVDKARNLLLIKGAVPGSKGGDIIIKPAAKAVNVSKVGS